MVMHKIYGHLPIIPFFKFMASGIFLFYILPRSSVESRELLTFVEALPFTPERYNRAKVILKDKDVKEILELLYTTKAIFCKIAKFRDK